MASIASMALRIDESLGLQINTCDVLFRGGGKINLDVFFPARKAVDERWEVVRKTVSELSGVISMKS
jgi:hypothetical protein